MEDTETGVGKTRLLAYGADGSGFALSWGVAAKVAAMVEKARLGLYSCRAAL